LGRKTTSLRLFEVKQVFRKIKKKSTQEGFSSEVDFLFDFSKIDQLQKRSEKPHFVTGSSKTVHLKGFCLYFNFKIEKKISIHFKPIKLAHVLSVKT
jgi:hypothetical protein